MSKINRRTFSLGSLLAGLAPRAADKVVPGAGQFILPPYSQPHEPVTKLGHDPLYKQKRIFDLRKQLLGLQREPVNMSFKNLEALKSVSPNVKYLLDHRLHLERRRDARMRDLINELCHLGDYSHGTPDTSGSDYYTDEAAPSQASQPY